MAVAMRIVPVLDVMGGVVVRAVRGDRATYRPLASQLTDSTDPARVAEAICTRHGWTEFYLADLDAIMGSGPAEQLFRRLNRAGFRLWVDAGVRERADAEPLLLS